MRDGGNVGGPRREGVVEADNAGPADTAAGRAGAGPVEIRRAGADDLDTAIGLLRRFFSEGSFNAVTRCMDDTLTTVIDHADSAVFLAIDEGKSIGIATNRIESALGNGRPSVIEHLYVLPDARRHGVASSLLAAALDWSQEQSCPSVFVTFRVEDDETHALTHFYARRGFDVVGETILARRLS
jgi:GNAT superfamily N-acetyltransferase